MTVITVIPVIGEAGKTIQIIDGLRPSVEGAVSMTAPMIMKVMIVGDILLETGGRVGVHRNAIDINTLLTQIENLYVGTPWFKEMQCVCNISL